MGKRAHPSVNRVHMKFADRPLSVTYMHNKTAPMMIMEDYNIRALAKKIFALQLMTNVIIERISAANALLIHILTHNSNMLVGEDATTMESFKKLINKQFVNKYKNIQIGVLPAKNIHTDVNAIARSIVHAIESTNGTNYMRLVRFAAEQVHKGVGLLGISVIISGRIHGGTIASNQKVKVGIVKAQTFTMDIKQAVYHAKTKTGMMGVKVTIAREVENRERDPFDEIEMRPRFNKPYDGKKFTPRAGGRFNNTTGGFNNNATGGFNTNNRFNNNTSSRPGGTGFNNNTGGTGFNNNRFNNTSSRPGGTGFNNNTNGNRFSNNRFNSNTTNPIPNSNNITKTGDK